MSEGIDRRSDVGSKVTISILSGVLLFLFSLFVNACWSIANEGKNKAFEIGERVTAIESKFTSIQGDLGEIKQLLRRRIPNESGDKKWL